jgi:curved DNA-binding protein CbpA
MGDSHTQHDPYVILGVSFDATGEEIAAAHRALARRFHPDVSTAPDAQHRMAEINTAWAILRDPARRALWDVVNRPASQRVHATGPLAGPAPGVPGRPVWHRGPHGQGAAGPPPGHPAGSVLPFGRHIGWSLGEIARVDPGYILWLRDRPEAVPYRQEIDRLLATMPAMGRPADAPAPRRSRFGR